ncbi:MAG: hypothetical protein ACD_5C00139G0008 [uncultured bacterium]|nr:MAG: hypothetical protein ACD_5C00139G0008 [uncultured bacterium]
MEKFLKKHYIWVIVAIMTFFTTVSLLNAKNDTATFDEVAHIPAGYSYITEHDMRLNPEHPPLLKDLIGIPLSFLNLNFDTNNQFWSGDGLNRIWDDGQWEAGKYLLYGAGNDPQQILFWARLPIILLSIILGLFLFKWGKELTGTLGGLFVLMLYAFDPNILGHNHYVTTDIGIAAFLTFAFYYILKFVKNPSWKNVFLAGLFLGLVNLTKFSSLMAYPILGLVIILYPLVKKISHNKEENSKIALRIKTFFEYIGKGLIILMISTMVVWIGYAFNTYKMPQDVIDRQINFSFPTNDPNKLSLYTNQVLTTINSSDLMRPMAEYSLGVAMVFKRVAGGNGTYFLQNVSSKALPIYFPFVFAVKETIPFIGLIVFSLIYTFAQIFKSVRSENAKAKFKRFLQVSVVEYTLLAFIVFYSILSITGNLNIGLRHLFPIIPFIYLLVTKKVFDFIRTKHWVTKHQLYIILIVISIWMATTAFFAYPGYVSYFNEAAGGSKNGFRLVTDSNTDWGQDLGRLKSWIEEYNSCAQTQCDPNLGFGCPKKCYQIAKPFPTSHESIDKIRIDYFGGGNPQYYLGEKYVSWWDSKRPIEKGWYAISANALQTSIYNKEKNPNYNYSWTLQYQPVTMIENSILIYYVDTPPVE